jgi:hypothetical protein
VLLLSSASDDAAAALRCRRPLAASFLSDAIVASALASWSLSCSYVSAAADLTVDAAAAAAGTEKAVCCVS